MKNIAVLSVLSLAVLPIALLASSASYAAGAGTAELKVTGTIKPAACTPSLTGGGTIDYGTIAASSLSQSAANMLPEKTVPFVVTCDAAMKLAVRIVDNRKASVISGLVASIGGIPDAYAYGLGTSAGKNIGIYSVRLIQSSFTADGTSPDNLTDNASNSGTWIKSGQGRFHGDGTERKAFSVAGTLVPAAYKTLSGTLGVQVVIDKASNLPLSADVTLDGSATIEVMYL